MATFRAEDCGSMAFTDAGKKRVVEDLNSFYGHKLFELDNFDSIRRAGPMKNIHTTIVRADKDCVVLRHEKQEYHIDVGNLFSFEVPRPMGLLVDGGWKTTTASTTFCDLEQLEEKTNVRQLFEVDLVHRKTEEVKSFKVVATSEEVAYTRAVLRAGIPEAEIDDWAHNECHVLYLVDSDDDE